MRSKYDFGKTKTKNTNNNKKKFNFKSSKQIKLSVSQTSEGDDSRTYASIDISTRETKDVEYEIPVPTQRYMLICHHQKTCQSYWGFVVRHLALIQDYKAEVSKC